MSIFGVELQQASLAVLETAMNKTLQLDQHALQKLQPLWDSIIGIELKGMAFVIYLRSDSQGIQLQSYLEGEADCLIRGTAIGLIKMTVGTQQTSGLFSGEVEIIGDVELGQKMKRVLDSIDIDWEEHLSTIVGDVAAYHLAHSVKLGKNWLTETATQVASNITDFLHYEQQNLPLPDEMNDYITATDKFRDDSERLEARVNRLQEILAKPSKNN